MREKSSIYHRYLRQTEKFQNDGKRIMLETRFTEFPALSVDARLFVLPIIEKLEALKRIFTITLYDGQNRNVIRRFSSRRVKNVCKQLMSLSVSCELFQLMNFPAPLKTEQTLSHREEMSSKEETSFSFQLYTHQITVSSSCLRVCIATLLAKDLINLKDKILCRT